MITIINKTPHPIYLVGQDNKVLQTFELCPKEELIRLSMNTVSCPELDGIPTSETEFGEAENLPEFQEEVYYIVSQLVKSAKTDRSDLLVPAEIVRNESGQIIGCRSLGR